MTTKNEHSHYVPDPNETILESLTFIAHGIARQFGSNCEVCIHDLKTSDPEHSIIYIINGHVTGRDIGDSPSKIVLESIEALSKGDNLTDHLCYLTKGTGGKLLKSSTIFVKDYNNEFHYVLSINLDISGFTAFDSALKSLININNNDTEEQKTEAIPNSVNELLDNLIEQSVALIGKAPALMNKEEKVKAINYLNDAGAFLIQKSGDKVSNYFGISKFTLYSYVDVKKKKEEL
ncbi:MAG: helix-turn-helix transcriptional regulator [Eubacteriales bacterium]|nr:helix-turn-helix transcriptional regulator [Eubacteriales bacterium]